MHHKCPNCHYQGGGTYKCDEHGIVIVEGKDDGICKGEVMPIEYKIYGCKYKCGYKHGDWISISGHEERCWKNVKNKTCRKGEDST